MDVPAHSALWQLPADLCREFEDAYAEAFDYRPTTDEAQRLARTLLDSIGPVILIHARNIRMVQTQNVEPDVEVPDQ